MTCPLQSLCLDAAFGFPVSSTAYSRYTAILKCSFLHEKKPHSPVVPHLPLIHHTRPPTPLTDNPPLAPSTTIIIPLPRRLGPIHALLPLHSPHRHLQPHQIQIPKRFRTLKPLARASARVRSGARSRLGHEDARAMSAWLSWRGDGGVHVESGG